MASDLVSLPRKDLPCSDGSTYPLSSDEMKELEEHIRSGHVTKSNICRGCLGRRTQKDAQRCERCRQGHSHSVTLYTSILLVLYPIPTTTTVTFW